MMKRPLAVIGFCCIAALAVALLLGRGSFGILCAVFLGGFGITVFSKKLRKMAWICLSGMAAVGMLWGYTNAYVLPSAKLQGQETEITGVLCELPYQQNDRYYYRLQTDSRTILVSSRYKIKMEPYDTLTATVRFYAETEPSRELYNISKGIMACGSIDPLKKKAVVKNEEKPLYYYALMARKSLTDRIGELLPEREAGFVTALMTGDKYHVQADDKEHFRQAGISHIIVVSGYHLAVLTQLMLGLFRLVFRKNKRPAAALCIVFVFLYMAVTGFSTPVMRAGIMQIFVLTGMVILRESDSLNILGLSGMIICVMNPYAVADVSFMMSFSATLGILLLSPAITAFLMERIRTDRLQKPIKAIVQIFSASLSACLFIMPICVVYFRQIAIYAVVTNVLVSFAVSALIYTAVFMLLTGLLPLVWTAWLLSDYVLYTAKAVAELPFSVIVTAQEFVPYWIMAAVITGLAVLLFRCRKEVVKYYALFTVISFLVCSVGDTFLKSDSVKISVLDVGNGISCIVNCENRTYLLSSGGSYYKAHALNEYLEDSCTKQIAYMLLLDDKNACTAYAGQILRDYRIETVQVYDEKDYTENVKYFLSKAGDKTDSSIVCIDDIRIQTVKEKNCMAVYAKCRGLRILAVEGKTDCEKLPESWHDTDILIVNGPVSNTHVLSAEILILSDEYEHLSQYEEMAQGDYTTVYATAGQGNISVRVYRRGQTHVRRENGWLN